MVMIIILALFMIGFLAVYFDELHKIDLILSNEKVRVKYFLLELLLLILITAIHIIANYAVTNIQLDILNIRASFAYTFIFIIVNFIILMVKLLIKNKKVYRFFVLCGLLTSILILTGRYINHNSRRSYYAY